MGTTARGPRRRGRGSEDPQRADGDAGPVVFLDEDDDVDWLDEDAGGRGGSQDTEGTVEAGRGAASLPPHASRRRLLVSAVALAVLAGGIGAAFTVAYHRHETLTRNANELVLQPGPGNADLPALTQLAFSQVWHAHPSEPVRMTVTNESPDPVQLLGASLDEPGLTSVATLKPVDGGTLAPGQSAAVSGNVTADCTQYLGDGSGSAYGSTATLSFAQATTPPSPGAPQPGLLVRARTANGSIHSELLQPGSGGMTLEQRICSQQGSSLLNYVSVALTGDPTQHTITYTVTTKSDADIPLQYVALPSLQPAGGGGLDLSEIQFDGIGYVIFPDSSANGTGTVEPGGSFTASYTLGIEGCGSQTSELLSSPEQFMATVSAELNHVIVAEQSYTAQLSSAVTDACG